VVDAELGSIIDEIYEAGVIPEQWPRLLGRLSSMVDGDGGLLFTASAERSSWTVSAEIEPLMDEFFRDGWAAINPRPQRLGAANYAGFVRDHEQFTPEELDNDPVYRDFYRKRGLGWATGTLLNVPSGDSIVFSFERAFAKGPIETKTVEFFDGLRPHLARASLLSSRLGLERAQAMAAALDIVGLPTAVLRERGRLYAVNPSFEQLIPDVVLDRRDRIAIVDRAADELLASACARLQLVGVELGLQSIPLVAQQERPAMVFHLIPVRRAANDVFMRATAVLVVTAVERSRVPNAEVLQALFDLTPAEARVARGIGEGRSLALMADDLNISQDTLRKQLKAVFGKTGLRRQAELAALLAGTTLPRRDP
jgi:DNA-binding CsgD family transcriptional regulator